MSKQDYFTAYDEQGNLIKYRSLSEIADEKHSGAILERLYREDGDDVMRDRLNRYRKQEAMQEKSDN